MKDSKYWQNYYGEERMRKGRNKLIAFVIIIVLGIIMIAQECRQKKVDDLSKEIQERLYGE